MSKTDTPPISSEAAFAFDKRVRKALLPYRETRQVKAIEWVSQGGDQLQMRLLAGGVMLAGALRRDPRMMGAGVRMLAAHELATFTKDWVKNRVIRSRPRSASSEDSKKPRKGHDKRKEQSSFPSGHAGGSFASARAFSAVYPEHAVAAQSAAGLLSLGRLPGCAHYPSDVAAGAAIGVGSSAAVTGAWRVGLAILGAWARRREGQR